MMGHRLKRILNLHPTIRPVILASLSEEPISSPLHSRLVHTTVASWAITVAILPIFNEFFPRPTDSAPPVLFRVLEWPMETTPLHLEQDEEDDDFTFGELYQHLARKVAGRWIEEVQLFTINTKVVQSN